MISLPVCAGGLLALFAPQEPASLDGVRKTQAQRTAVIAKAQPSVCSVLSIMTTSAMFLSASW